MTAKHVAPQQAAFAIIAGMFTLGFTDNLVALIVETSSLSQFHLLRSALVIAGLLLVSALGGGAVLPRRPGAVIARSALTASAMVIYFGCIAVMPIGVAVAGLFTAPVFMLLIALIFEGKRVGPVRMLAVALGFAGALLVIRPDPGNMDWIALLPVLAGLLYAGGAVATRAWCEGESTLCLSVWFFAMLMAAGGLGAALLPTDIPGADGFPLRGWMPMDAATWGWFGIMSVGALVGIFLIFRGYQLGEASYVAVFEYSMLVFASGWALILWGETLPPIALLGMVLIAVAGSIIALRGESA